VLKKLRQIKQIEFKIVTKNLKTCFPTPTNTQKRK